MPDNTTVIYLNDEIQSSPQDWARTYLTLKNDIEFDSVGLGRSRI